MILGYKLIMHTKLKSENYECKECSKTYKRTKRERYKKRQYQSRRCYSTE